MYAVFRTGGKQYRACQGERVRIEKLDAAVGDAVAFEDVLLVGWWASAIVMAIGWALLLPIITIPIGLVLFNRVPFVASLYRY